MQSNVYFTSFRTRAYGDGILQKLHKLMKKAGFETMELEGKFTAIKLHFGEAGNLSFLRPNYAKVVADYVKELGGRPFLTDCNTLYVGSRGNALDHLDTAMANGFSMLTTGCQVVIADGLKGTDDVELPVPNGKLLKTARIGRAIADADAFITLTHFKGHEKMGIGGAIKNIGMGCGSRAGKMVMHSDGKPSVMENCVGCGLCRRACAHDALHLQDGRMTVDHRRCAGCGSCIGLCTQGALQPTWDQENRLLDEKTAEYAAAVLNGKPAFHINVLCDISPNCDCHGENDAPILPNIGMLASFDPVALDVASVDLCNRAPRLPGTHLDKCPESGDVFNDAHTVTRWHDTIAHAVALGLGNEHYKLIEL